MQTTAETAAPAPPQLEPWQDDFSTIYRSGQFDHLWYAARYLDVGLTDMSPLEHYVKYGARLVQLYREASVASPNGAPVVGEDTMLRWLETSGLYDRDFYLKCNGDVASAGADPTQHYFNHGYAEARPPSAL